jgi:hypothetical protein
MAIQATTSTSVSVANTDTGLTITGTGSVVLTIASGTKCSDIQISAGASNQPLDFPLGVTTAQFIFLKAVSGDDVKLQVTTASGATTFDVPEGGAFLAYNVDACDVSTVNGATIQFIVGG